MPTPCPISEAIWANFSPTKSRASSVRSASRKTRTGVYSRKTEEAPSTDEGRAAA